MWRGSKLEKHLLPALAFSNEELPLGVTDKAGDEPGCKRTQKAFWECVGEGKG